MSLRLLAAMSRLADAPGAEVVVFDDPAGLSDSGGVERSPSRFHGRAEGPGRYLRILDLDAAPDLRTAGGLDGILLEGVASQADVERLGARLAVAEAEAGIPEGTLRILPVIDTPRGALSLPKFKPLPRLFGIACDPDGLAAALGCAGDAPAAAQARALTVLAAAACGVPAILVSRDMDTAAEREGFAGILLDDRR